MAVAIDGTSLGGRQVRTNPVSGGPAAWKRLGTVAHHAPDPVPARRRVTPEDHAAGVRAWRAERDERLRSPDGWLTLAGLYWLEQGENRFGADPANPSCCPARTSRRLRARSCCRGDSARLQDVSEDVRIDGQPAGDGPLADDRSEEPTVLELGDLRMHVICRGGDRLALARAGSHRPRAGGVRRDRALPDRHRLADERPAGAGRVG